MNNCGFCPKRALLLVSYVPNVLAARRPCADKGEAVSILFVLLTFLLIVSVMYFRGPKAAEDSLRVANQSGDSAPLMINVRGLEVPGNYAFHPGHTWLNDEGHQNARVGMDAFAANLLGEIDSIDFSEPNRWVRQGQRLCTITRAGRKVELLSPVEGVLVAINQEVKKAPNRAIEDPYRTGWLCSIKAPELSINGKNLLRGPLVPAWMKNSIAQLSERMQAQSAPALAQDGGLPIKGLLFHVSPELQQQLAKEFFLT